MKPWYGMCYTETEEEAFQEYETMKKKDPNHTLEIWEIELDRYRKLPFLIIERIEKWPPGRRDSVKFKRLIHADNSN